MMINRQLNCSRESKNWESWQNIIDRFVKVFKISPKELDASDLQPKMERIFNKEEKKNRLTKSFQQSNDPSLKKELQK